MEKLVTIAVALYNNEKYVERCLKSIFNQTYSNFELIIIDDGSLDNSLEICKPYEEDKRCRIIKKTNGGLSSVRQIALNEAAGDYICFIDADDYLKENYIERMLNKLIEDHSDVCVCSTIFEDENGFLLTEETKIFKCNDSEVVFKPQISNLNNIDDDKIGELHVSDSWNKMYNVSFLRKNHLCFNMPKGFNGTDLLFNRKLTLYSPNYSTVGDYCYVHVMYKSSAVHRKRKNLLQMYILITDELMKAAENIGIRDGISKFLSLFYHRGLYASFLDVYDEIGNLDTMKTEFSQMLRYHKRFVSNNKDIKKYFHCEKQLHFKFFNFVLYYLNGILPYLFRIRDFLRK